MAIRKTPARRAPAVKKTLAMTEKGTTLTITPAKVAPKKAPAAKTPRAKKTPAPVVAPAIDDLALLEKTLKSAKGVLWTMNDRAKKGGSADPAKIAAQEAKVADLAAQWAERRPVAARGYDGPSWVVSLDAASGDVWAERAADPTEARNLSTAARESGYVVNVIRATS
jgi:hypothetical protein